MRRARWAIIAALVLHASVASADDEVQARAAFDKGVELYRAKKFREAAEQFDRALRFAPRGPTAYNAGGAWRSANEPARAADAFASALDLGGLSDAQKKNATEQLKTLDASLGILDLDGPAGAQAHVGDADHPLPSHVHVAPGAFKVVFTSGTTTEEKTGTVGKGERIAIVWQPAAKERAVVAATSPTPPPLARPAEPPRDPHRERRVLSIGTIVVGGIMLVGGVFVGVDGLSARDRFVDGGQQSRLLHDRAEEQRTWANVLGIGGVALIAAGVYFLVTTPKWEPAAYRGALW